LLNPGAQLNAAGDSVSLALTASLPRGTLSYSAAGLPSGLSINPTSGLISGSLGSAAVQATPYEVTVTAADATGQSNVSFAWTVGTLVLPGPGNPTNLDGDTVSLALGAHYNGTATLTYSASGLPAGLTLNTGSGLISGTLPANADVAGPYDVMVTATAGGNSASQEFSWEVDPRIALQLVGDQANVGGDTVSLAVSATDAVSGTLTYSATGLPPGLTLNSSTGLIAGTIAPGAATLTPYGVTIAVGDGTVSVSESLNWTVAGLGLTAPAQEDTVRGQSVSLSLHGRAADGGGLTYSATGLPAGLSLNTSTGLISGTPTTLGLYLVGLTATESLYSATQALEWEVLEIALPNPGDQSNTEGDAVSLAVQGVSDGGGSLTYSASGLPAGLSVNPSTGLISGTVAPGAAANGPYWVVLTVANGTVAGQVQFNWTVAPYVSLTAPADQSSIEGATVSLAVQATDAGSLALTYSASGLPAGLSINAGTGLISGTVSSGDALNGPSYIVTLTASGGSYSSTQTFNWSLRPAVAPAAPVVTNPGTQSNQTGEEVNLQIEATDAAGYTLTYAASGLPDGLAIDPGTGLIGGVVSDDADSSMPYSVTVTADDGVGETTNQTFQWLVSPSPIQVQATSFSAVAGTNTGSIAVATFTTPDLNSWAGDFFALINWGDGSADVGTVSGQNGTFTVSASHTYEQMGPLSVGLTVIDGSSGGSASASATTTVSAAPWTLTGGFRQGVIAGQSASPMLATLQDSDPAIVAGNFSVQINPGDGSASVTGTVTPLGNGVWAVAMPYTYGQTGTYTDTITVTGPGGVQASATSSVAVGDLYAGVSSTLTAMPFAVGNSSAQASQYTATIQWGDGTSGAGTVSGSNGRFTVQGTHTYAADSLNQLSGAYQVTVQLSNASGSVLSAGHSVVLVRPQMALQVANVPINADGTVSTQAIAAFEEPDASDSSGEFAATINWGDGTTSAGTISGSGGLFQVAGGHTYAAADSYLIQVEVAQGASAKQEAAMDPGAARRMVMPQKFLSEFGKIIIDDFNYIDSLGRQNGIITMDEVDKAMADKSLDQGAAQGNELALKTSAALAVLKGEFSYLSRLHNPFLATFNGGVTFADMLAYEDLYAKGDGNAVFVENQLYRPLVGHLKNLQKIGQGKLFGLAPNQASFPGRAGKVS
jgi:hypothetical protein